MRNPIPIVILAGSDRRATRLPEDGRDKHPLSGYKGVDIRVEGRPLVETIVERLRGCCAFDPIYVVGPAAAYGTVAGAELIDSNGSFGENIHVALTRLPALHPGLPVAFTVCDIVPEVATLRKVLRHYESVSPCDLWFPLIEAPPERRRLGASAWKPRYRIQPTGRSEAVSILPGHLAIVDPIALRTEFVCRLVQLGYTTRNRSIGYRRLVMVRGVVFALLYQDLRHVLGFELPSLTWSVLIAGIRAAGELRAGTITQARLEDAMRKVFMARKHRRRHPERQVSMPIVDGISLALDIDTEEEAAEMGVNVKTRSA